MNHFVIIFSALLIISLGVGIILWLKNRKPYIISFLETGTPGLGSYKESIKTDNRYFYHSGGRVDLKKHPELHRFRELYRHKEYLVEPWDRKSNLYINDDGKTKIVVFEIIPYKENSIVLIPCLRTVNSIIDNKTEDPLSGYRETLLGVAGDNELEIIKSNDVLGIVKYESL